eukprot:1507266-Prymnesium_polylepis.1
MAPSPKAQSAALVDHAPSSRLDWGGAVKGAFTDRDTGGRRSPAKAAQSFEFLRKCYYTTSTQEGTVPHRDKPA